MSNDTTLARPYARAAFELAKQAGQFDAWSSALSQSGLLAADAEVRALLANPSVSRERSVQLIQPQGDAPSAFQGLLNTMAENQRLDVLPAVQDQFETLRAEHERRRHVTIRTAAQIDADMLQTIKAALNKRFGTEVEIEEVVDPSLIGGAIIDAGDEVIDGSVQARLHKLQQAIIG